MCSSWVWVARSTTRRSREHPEGDSRVHVVYQGNLIMKLTVAVLLVGFLRGCNIFIEQPCSSVMEFMEPMRSFVELIATSKVRTFLGAFGSTSPKLITIYTNCEDAATLKRSLPAGVEWEQLVKKDKGAVTGIRDRLKSSQAYPLGFGCAVAALTSKGIRKHTLKKFGFDTLA